MVMPGTLRYDPASVSSFRSEAHIPSPPSSLVLDKARHDEVWRMVAYLAGNCLVAMQLRQMRLYDLTPIELLVFNVIALSNVQRSIRHVRHLDRATADIEPSNEINGTISRRRIADTTELPRSTVARVVQRLVDRKFVVERARGRLQIPVGLVLQGRYAIDAEELYRPIVQLIEQYLRLGIVVEAGAPWPGAKESVDCRADLEARV